ncbi:hypothetical protein [Streptomyces zaehneri]|uniref:hypothetical protein n=1 Tax=Streptomyces zaehneri TaxID=3051180 RepID=UPI0028D4E198|nr:hypothetical protein [Streptomyces sp. DSM 40713]
MLENWYFCASLGFSAQDAAAHLDVIEALGEPVHAADAEELVCAALDHLRQTETATALHALPHVLAAHRRFTGVSTEVTDRASDLYRDIASVLPSRLMSPVAELLRTVGGGEPAHAVELLGEVLRQAARGAGRPTPGAQPYHDLLQQPLPTVALTAARFLVRLDPHAVREPVDDHASLVDGALAGDHGRQALLQAAELKAALSPGEADAVWEDLDRASNGAMDLEPDLLRTAARVMFAPDTADTFLAAAAAAAAAAPDTDDEPEVPDALLLALETEALAGTRLLARLARSGTPRDTPAADAQRQAAYTRLGGVAGHRHSAMPSVLWQAALWSLSAELAPRRTALRLARWWRAPDAPPKQQKQKPKPCRISVPHHDYVLALTHVGRLHGLRAPHQKPPALLLSDGPVDDTAPGDAAAVWSPWMLPALRPRLPRQGSLSGPGSSSENAPPPDEEEVRRQTGEENARLRLSGSEPEQLVRLLAAGLLASRLLTAVATDDSPPDHLLLLVLHVRDAMSHRKLLLDLAQGDARRFGELTGYLAPLLLHGRSQVDRIGKGVRPMVPPGEIVRVVSSLYPASQTDQDAAAAAALRHHLVNRGQALNACLLWVLETSSGGTGPQRTEAGGRWFRGEHPPARTLLSLALQQQDDPYTRTAIDASLLSREIYREERTGLLRWDWAENGPQFAIPPRYGVQSALIPRALVLSGPTDEERQTFSVREWERMDRGLRALAVVTDKYGVTPITLHTLRLAALLQRPDLGDTGHHEEWATAWSDLVESLNSATHLPRPVRGRMLEMFGSPVAGARSQERLLQVLERVVKVIIDVSGGAQFFYERLFDELGSAAQLPPESANHLRLLTIRALYDKWGHGPLAADQTNPFGAYGSRVTARGTEKALAQFLRDTADQQVQAVGKPLADMMTGLWRRSHLPARLPRTREDLDGLSADPRLVTAAMVDRRTGQAVLYKQGTRLDVAVFEGRRVQVHDLYATGSDTGLPSQGAFVLGTVCATRETSTHRLLWINCGLPKPVTVRLDLSARDRAWRTGQALAVHILPGDLKATGVAPLAAPEPTDGEVRSARLRPIETYPWLSLDVRDMDHYVYPRGEANRDIAARLRWDPDLLRPHAPEGGGCVAHTTLAVWDSESRHWLPQDAGLPELAVEVTAAAGPVGADAPEHGRVRLVLCGAATDRSGFGPAYRFVTTPGRCYVLGASAWEPADWERLEEACLREPAGLIVHAEFRPGESQLRLAASPRGTEPFDHRNLRWLALFQSGADTVEGYPDDEPEAGPDPYRVAHLRETANGGSEWRIEVPGIDGFPRWVTAIPPAGRQHHDSPLLCAIEGWKEPQARKGQVRVEPFQEQGVTGAPDVGRYAELARLSRGAEVDIVWTSTDDSAPENFARLSCGLVGFAATDSLTLSGLFPRCTTMAPRRAVVLDDPWPKPLRRPRQQPVPLTTGQLTEGCADPGDAADLDRDDLAGMVVARIRASGQIVGVRVWLHLETRVVLAAVPVHCLDNERPSVGDHVTGRRTAGGWVFTVLSRRLKLRALWDLTDSRPRTDEWQPVGAYEDERGGRELYQHPHLARLAAGPPRGSGVTGKAQARVDKYARPSDDGVRAVVQHAGTHYVGTAAGADLTDDFRAVHVERTWLEPYDGVVSSPVDGGFVDIHRRFLLSPTSRSRPPVRRPAPRRVLDPAAEWRRFMEGPAPVVTGQLTSQHRVVSHISPMAPDDDGQYRPWLALLDEPRTLVAGRPPSDHHPDRVRAVPVPHGRGARASFLRVPPVSLAEFIKEVMPHARVDGRRHEVKDQQGRKRRPFYVGAQEVGDQGLVHRFEFGYGWFLDLPADALTVGGKPVDPSGITLFHGDRVRAMSFHADDGPVASARVVVDIAPGDVVKGDERHVYAEGTHRDHQVVHVLDIDIDHAARRVSVLRAHTSLRGPSRRGEGVRVETVSISATLDEKSERALLDMFGPDTRSRRILGRVRRRADGGDAHQRLCFAFVPPQPAPDDGTTPGLRTGDHLYLVAGMVVQTDNDRLLPFTLPEVPAPDGDALVVTVSRRNFSYRESALRLAAEDQYDRAKLLVRLLARKPDTDNHWFGITRQAPERALATLRSHLEDRGGDCFAVVTDSGTHVEVRPGVLFPVAGLRTRTRLAPGSVVRLRPEGPHEVAARQAIAAETTYLDDRPRPAVVFPKDDFKTEQDLKGVERRRGGGFTVAGLPAVSAGADQDMGELVLSTDHPKIVGVVRASQNGGRADARLVPMGQGQGGTVSCRAGQAVQGARVLWQGAAGTQPAVPDSVVPWAQLSFMDATAEEIALACHERGWRYHDTWTRTWVRARRKFRRQRLAQPAHSVDEPVFFSRTAAGWTLRHRRSELRRFGFPATELLEDVQTDSAARTNGHWVVAGAGRRSVWLELAPGRIAEVSAELIQFTDGSSLADLDCTLFSPGDLVQGRVEGGVNECGHLVLTRWHPGPRGALASPTARRMLLPVEHADEVAGALHLGEGRAGFRYPAARDVLDAHPVRSAVWLDDTNSLTPLDDDPLRPGDVVFAAAGTSGALRILGLPHARVRLSEEAAEGAWPRCTWLRQDLAAAGGSRLLANLGSVPMTVEHVEAAPDPVVTVSRRSQPRAAWPDGSVLIEPVADLGKGYLVVRTGSALIRVHVRTILPGLPEHPAAAPSAAAALVTHGSVLRFHWNPRTATLSSGPEAEPEAQDRRETAIRPLVAVSDSQDRCLGLICREEQTRQLCWLPAEEAAWTQRIPGEVLLRHLGGVRRLDALRTGRGTVTLTGHPMIAREYDRLTLGHLRHVRTVHLPVAPRDAEHSGLPRADDRCLVSVEPLGMLADYSPAEPDSMPVLDETFMAEVSRIERGRDRTKLKLVEQGSRLTVTDLPEWMCDALGSLHIRDFLTPAAEVPGLIPERFAAYRSAWEDGLSGAGPGQPDPTAAYRVLHALGTMETMPDVPRDTRGEADRVTQQDGRTAGETGRSPDADTVARAEAAARRAVHGWLCSQEGRNFVLQRDAVVDLAPVLAVCRLGSLIDWRTVRLRDGWLAYLLCRLGERAVSSLHVEALVTGWLARPERHRMPGDWRRLRTLELQRNLTRKQLTNVVQYGQAVAGGVVIGQRRESQAAPVARALLAAVGQLPSAARITFDTRQEPVDAPLLRALGDLGAGLRPAAGRPVPPWRPRSEQLDALHTVTRTVLRDSVPLALLPSYAPLTPEARRYGSALLKEARSQLDTE